MNRLFAVVILVFTLLQVTIACSWAPVYGVDDVVSKNNIDRANRISKFREKRQYSDLVLQLERDSIAYGTDPYSSVRILNELADLYTYQLLDLDMAIALDKELQQREGSDVISDTGINPRVRVANNTV